MRSHTSYRHFPLTYANYFILFTGVIVILFSGWLYWVTSDQRQQMKNFSTISTTEITGTVKSIHIPHRSEYITFTLNEYQNSFELFDWFGGYDRIDLFLKAENAPSVSVTLTVDEEEWSSNGSVVPVYGIAVDGETVFTKEDYLRLWEEASGDFLYMEVGCALTGLVFLAWGWFWREKPKDYSPFSRY